MEGFKGTPGPWVNVGGWVDSDKPGDLSSIICAIYSVTPGNPKAVNDANANLIAAAPELLEALQELVFLYEHDEGCRDLTEYKRAKSTLAKALGQ